MSDTQNPDGAAPPFDAQSDLATRHGSLPFGQASLILRAGPTSAAELDAMIAQVRPAAAKRGPNGQFAIPPAQAEPVEAPALPAKVSTPPPVAGPNSGRAPSLFEMSEADVARLSPQETKRLLDEHFTSARGAYNPYKNIQRSHERPAVVTVTDAPMRRR
jgi:hypothetical protein